MKLNEYIEITNEDNMDLMVVKILENSSFYFDSTKIITTFVYLLN